MNQKNRIIFNNNFICFINRISSTSNPGSCTTSHTLNISSNLVRMITGIITDYIVNRNSNKTVTTRTINNKLNVLALFYFIKLLSDFIGRDSEPSTNFFINKNFFHSFIVEFKIKFCYLLTHFFSQKPQKIFTASNIKLSTILLESILLKNNQALIPQKTNNNSNMTIFVYLCCIPH